MKLIATIEAETNARIALNAELIFAFSPIGADKVMIHSLAGHKITIVCGYDELVDLLIADEETPPEARANPLFTINFSGRKRGK